MEGEGMEQVEVGPQKRDGAGVGPLGRGRAFGFVPLESWQP